ncbi:MAG: hypothetical protein GY714_03440 [Desulfobacterales bacterium]|nr:hypothetical protein [Desulfobacterales bacterium]
MARPKLTPENAKKVRVENYKRKAAMSEKRARERKRKRREFDAKERQFKNNKRERDAIQARLWREYNKKGMFMGN